jgi:hypothetical protein
VQIKTGFANEGMILSLIWATRREKKNKIKQEKSREEKNLAEADDAGDGDTKQAQAGTNS